MSVYGYKYGRVPEELLYSTASDRACRLHAVLTRWADTRPEEHPTRRELAAILHCSMDSLDRALKELAAAGFLKVTPRSAEGVRIANVYEVDIRGGRTDAGGGRTRAATITSANGETPGDGGRTGAVRGGRTGAAVIDRTQITTELEEIPAPPPAAEARNEKVEQPRPEVDALCQHLADRIIANGGSEARYRPKPTTKAWRDPMRRLIDRDGISPDRIRKAIDWCQADDFWKGVILSPANLRENYDKLRLAAQRPTNGNGNGNGYRNGQPERRGPTIPEADLSQLPPTDPEKLREWYDRQLEGLPT